MLRQICARNAAFKAWTPCGTPNNGFRSAQATLRPAHPNPDQRRGRDERQERVDEDQEKPGDAAHIGRRRWRPWIEVAPYGRGKTEGAEQNQHAGIRPNQPLRQHAVEQRMSADAARQREQTGAHPRRIGTLGRQNGAIGGQARGLVGAAFDLGRRLFQLPGAIGDGAAVLGDGFRRLFDRGLSALRLACCCARHHRSPAR